MSVQSKLLHHFCLLILLACATSSCSPHQQETAKTAVAEPTPNEPKLGRTDAAEVQANRNRWHSSKVDNYRFVLDAECFCALEPRSPVAIEVREGESTSIKPLEESDSFYFHSESYKQHDTIDDLFNVIEEALNRNAEIVNVAYDPTFGYPLSVAIDRRKSFADDELSLWVKQFEVVK